MSSHLTPISAVGSAFVLAGCCTVFGLDCPTPPQSSLEQFFYACFGNAQLPPQAMLVYTGPVDYDTGDLWLHLPPNPPDRRESFSKNVSAAHAGSLRTRLADNQAVTCSIDVSQSTEAGTNIAAAAAMVPVAASAGLDLSKGRITKVSVDRAWLDEIDRGSKLGDAWGGVFNPAHPVSLGISEGKYKVAVFAMRVKGYRVQYQSSDAAKLAANGTYTKEAVGDLKGEVKWEKKANDVVELYVEGPTNIAFILRPLGDGFAVQAGDPNTPPAPPVFVVPRTRGGQDL